MQLPAQQFGLLKDADQTAARRPGKSDVELLAMVCMHYGD